MNRARLCFLLILCGLLIPAELRAGPASFPCYDDDQDVVFSSSEAIVSDQKTPGWKMPKFELSKDQGKRDALRWVPVPEKTNVDDDLLGYYRGQEVHRLAYSQPDDSGEYESEDGTKSTLLCVVVGIVTSRAEADQTRFRPFFVTGEGSVIEKVECYFASTDARPFALRVRKSLLGTARAESDYTFDFKPDGVRLVERVDSATRKHPYESVSATTTYQYSAAGKLVAVKRGPEHRMPIEITLGQ